jgi:hypothetical protein
MRSVYLNLRKAAVDADGSSGGGRRFSRSGEPNERKCVGRFWAGGAQPPVGAVRVLDASENRAACNARPAEALRERMEVCKYQSMFSAVRCTTLAASRPGRANARSTSLSHYAQVHQARDPWLRPRATLFSYIVSGAGLVPPSRRHVVFGLLWTSYTGKEGGKRRGHAGETSRRHQAIGGKG